MFVSYGAFSRTILRYGPLWYMSYGAFSRTILRYGALWYMSYGAFSRTILRYGALWYMSYGAFSRTILPRRRDAIQFLLVMYFAGHVSALETRLEPGLVASLGSWADHQKTRVICRRRRGERA
jgi:hypothetical protein